MALDTESLDIYGQPAPPRFVEYGWIEKKLEYCVIALRNDPGTVLPGPPRLTRIVTMAWPAELSAGGRFRPCWWQLIEAPRLPYQRPTQPDTLLLVLSPDVEIVSPKRPLPGLTGDRARVNFQIVRVESRAAVPQRGESLRPSTLDPVKTYVRAEFDKEFASWAPGYGIQPTKEEVAVEALVPEVTGTEADMLSGIDHARILREPGRCAITHDAPGKQSWRVEITHDAGTDPGSFAVEVVGLPMPRDPEYISYYRVRVVTCGAVTVRASQAPIVNPGFTPDSNPFGIHVSHLDIEVAEEHDQSAMPFDGWDVSQARGFKALSPYSLWSGSEAFAVTAFANALEMIPVIGSFIEFGGLLYAAAYGRTWYGDEVSDADLVQMGVFALIGVVPGVSSGMLKRLADAGGTMFPKVALVSMNPGLVMEARAMLANGPRLLRDFAAKVDSGTLDEMLKLLEAAIKTGKRSELARTIGDLMLPALVNARSIDGLSASHILDQMEHIAIESVRGFDALPLEEAGEVTRAFKLARKLADPGILKTTLNDLGRAEVWAQYFEEVRDSIVFRLFTDDFSAIRDPGVAGEMVYRSLLGDFGAYAGGKLAKSKKARAALEWIMSLNDGVFAARLMEAELGMDWRAMLKPFLDARRYAVSADLARDFREFASSIMGYADLRDAISGKGFGMLFQVDHLLEQRFLKYMPDAFQHETADFLGFLVPWNKQVASNLEAHGVSEFLYVHSEKTHLLRTLIPYGKEGEFTTQEYFYVYQYVYMKKFCFAGRDFERSLFDLFEHMNEARLMAGTPPTEAPLVMDIVASADDLFAKIVAAHNRLNLTLTTPP